MRKLDLSKIGERIKKQRGKKGQDFLARKAGITQKTLSTWEKGNLKAPKLTVFVDICNALDCNADYLLNGIDHTTYKNLRIHEEIGLSSKAINNLKRINDMNGGIKTNQSVLASLNKLLEHDDFIELLCMIYDYQSSLLKNLSENKTNASFQLFSIQELFRQIINDISDYNGIRKHIRDSKRKTDNNRLFNPKKKSKK